MLLQIPDVLTPQQVAQARTLLQEATWTDGRVTAGYQSAKAKDNQQLPEDSPAARQLGAQEKHVCIGQKQVWFLLRLVGDESHVRLDLTESPEFDHWRWVDFWYPMQHVVMFKRGVYARALCHLAPFAQLVAGTQAVPQMLMEAWMPHMGMGRPPPRRPAAKRGGDRSAK